MDSGCYQARQSSFMYSKKQQLVLRRIGQFPANRCCLALRKNDEESWGSRSILIRRSSRPDEPHNIHPGTSYSEGQLGQHHLPDPCRTHGIMGHYRAACIACIRQGVRTRTLGLTSFESWGPGLGEQHRSIADDSAQRLWHRCASKFGEGLRTMWYGCSIKLIKVGCCMQLDL